MSPRTGRPKVEHPKDIKFSMRLDQDLHDKLVQYCEKHNIKKTVAIREAILMMISEG